MNFEQSAANTILESHESTTEISEIESLLLEAERAEQEIDGKLSEKYGEEFLPDLSRKMRDWGERFLEKGDATLNWAEMKGFPIPKSKAGLYLYSGASGALGVVVPGLGVLLPLSYIFYKRAAEMKAAHLRTQ